MFGLLYSKLMTMLGGGRGDRRRQPREEVTLGTVDIGGRAYPVKNWSTTGFLAAPCDCKCREGDRVDIRFHVDVPGKSVRFACKASLVRVNREPGEVAGVFTMMEREDRVLVAGHFG